MTSRAAQAFASQILGLYTGLVYFTPLLGGLIADRWIGQRNAVVLGALSMSGGRIAMAFDRGLLAPTQSHGEKRLKITRWPLRSAGRWAPGPAGLPIQVNSGCNLRPRSAIAPRRPRARSF